MRRRLKDDIAVALLVHVPARVVSTPAASCSDARSISIISQSTHTPHTHINHLHTHSTLYTPIHTHKAQHSALHCTHYLDVQCVPFGCPARAMERAGPGGHSEGSEIGSYGARLPCGVSS